MQNVKIIITYNFLLLECMKIEKLVQFYVHPLA